MSEDWTWLYETTRTLAERLPSASFEELVDYMERREAVIARLQAQQAVPSEATKRFFDIAQFQQWDRLVLAKLRQMSKQAEQELGKLAAGKQVKSGYEAYSTQTSFFFDSKK
ncbi:hypothetical protein [Paenibacillus koleovorans]|uniref:hypothetical protein n=1 Tax=Paenibacillus koleovorans TaxID=121608 RepID=UPI000FD811CD|nr:hypothetical protein [Paenibacillus koleovorans]